MESVRRDRSTNGGVVWVWILAERRVAATRAPWSPNARIGFHVERTQRQEDKDLPQQHQTELNCAFYCCSSNSAK